MWAAYPLVYRQHRSMSERALVRPNQSCCLVPGVFPKHLQRVLPLSAQEDTASGVLLAERVQQLQLAMSGQDVGIVGLHGMGGIGKTTLPRAFYAEQAKSPVFRRRVLLHVGQDAQDEMLRIRCAETLIKTSPCATGMTGTAWQGISHRFCAQAKHCARIMQALTS